MANEALIVWGGWDGHEPQKLAERFRRELTVQGLTVEVRDTLDAFLDAERLRRLALIVPIWTMGTITADQLKNVTDAVAGGVGLAGCHGGMCDAFRDAPEWQFMTGGQWVAHPGNDGVRYTIKIGPKRGPINRGLSDFEMTSEQYYLHVDPAVKVWAHTEFPVADGPHARNGPVSMPQVWTKQYGEGRVFYNALGHADAVFDVPEATELMRRGFQWAGRTHVCCIC